MANEVETKVLEVDPEKIFAALMSLGAEKILDTTFVVDWYRTTGSKEGDDQWYLRVRTTSDGKTEVTWKGLSQVLGASRTHREINVGVDSAEKIGELFKEINLEHYGHQEKRRVSWSYKNWRFDLDAYPGIPPYLEIEGKDEAHIQEAIALLGLQKNAKYPGGERILISEKYGLNWYEMRF